MARSMTKGLVAVFAVASATAAVAQGPSSDWTQWRGPNRDGSAPSFTPPANWPAALTERWRVEVGTGYASPLIVGDRVFVHARQGNDEVVLALDAASGKQIWTARPFPATPWLYYLKGQP